MNAIGFEEFEVEASVTDRFQTTLPTAVRAVLGVGKREKIVYRISGGLVQVARANEDSSDDAALKPFLALLSKRLASHASEISPYTAEEADADRELVRGVKIA